MDAPHHDETIDETPIPTPAAPASRRSAFVGALLGMTALAGTIVGVGTVAGALDEPTPEPPPETTTASGDDADDADDASMPFDTAFAAFADFAAFEACMAEQLGDLWIEPEIVFDELDLEGLTDLDAVPFGETDEQVFVDAEEACNDLLPDDMKAELDAWAAFDDCLRDAGGLDDEFGGADAVHIETGDGAQIVEFGSIEGSVTISGIAGDLSVVTAGGATLIGGDELDARWAELDEAHAACEELLPEHAFGGFEIFEGRGFESGVFESRVFGSEVFGELDD